MNRHVPHSRVKTLSRRLLVALAGFACTLPALATITFPTTPLQTGASVPPNVMMLFDNSGSMYWTYLYIHTSTGAFPTITVPASSTTAAFTSVNTGDEINAGSFSGLTDAYGSSDCSQNGSSGTVDTSIGCIPPSFNSDKYMVDQSYATNGLYYNPSSTYTPWHYPDGTQQANATYNAAYQSRNFSNGYSWTAVDGSTKITLTSPTVNLGTHTETYYVPRTTTSKYCTTIDTTNADCYYRYQILGSTEFPSASLKIYRSELLQATDVGTVGSSNSNLLTQTGVSAAKSAFSTIYSVTVPTGATSLTVTTSGGTGADAGLYVRQGTSSPTTTTYTCRSITTGTNSQSCVISSPTAGTYKIGVYGNGAAVAGVTITATAAIPNFTITSGTTGVGCNDTNVSNYDWRNCTETTPTGNSETAEELNFANWYSFYQSRIKTAKASLSAAFSALTTIPRVGFRDIWDRVDFDIPVGTDDGLFEDKAATTTPVAAATINKTSWFKTVMGEIAYNGTPLRDALNSVGEYYSNVNSKNGTSGVTHTDINGTGSNGPETGTSQLTCRQNFTILSTDGYWNETFAGVSGDANSDDTSGPTNTSADGTTTLTYSPVSPYVGPTSDTLADVAEHYWKTDLRTDLANKVPTSTADPAFWQHMVTFTISIGAAGELVPATVLQNIANGVNITWPVPLANEPTTIDDLFHAAINGHGSFVVASDPATFVNALTNALAAIQQRTAAAANVSTSSAKLTTSTNVFEANFVVGAWTGDLTSYALNSTTGAIATSPSWQASKLLPPATTPYNGITPLTFSQRKIFTISTGTGTTFPTAAQTAALGGTTGANYIMGDQSNEVSNGGTFRNRTTTVLGDMIDSTPAYVAAATSGTPTIPMLYVGSNDGMMHAFNANTGVEVFAYVPGGESMSNLKTLENSNYVHQYSVDGSIVVSTQAQTTDTADSTGKNILVGVLGRGGNSVYALDVTDPANFAASKVLWEYTDANMGNSLGEPIITKLNIADTGTGNTAVIIGNGYNSANGHAVLHVLNIRTGALIATLDSQVGNTTTVTNGMSTPVGWDADHNGTADLLYAGDLQGNVWEWNISGSTASSWKPAFGTTASPTPLYTAEDASGNRQPITSGMDIGLNPADFTRWVFFGTGEYITSGDPSNDNVQTWYGLQDSGTAISTVTTRNSTILRQRTVTTTTLDGETVRYFSQAATGDMTGLRGWYIDLLGNTTSSTVAQGERIVSDTVLLGNVLLAASIIPSTDVCDVGGDGFINAVSPFTGAALSADFFDVNGDGKFDTSDEVKLANGTYVPVGSIDPGVGLPSLPSFISNVTTTSSTGKVCVGGSNGTTPNCTTVNDPTSSGRISWREILQGN